MSRKLLATTVLATLFASASFAQTSDDPTTSPGATTTPDWDQSINDVFFEDESAGLVRSDDEIQERWQSLSADEQAQVRDDCAAMTADAGGTMDTMAPGDTAMDTGGEFETDTSAAAGADSLDADPLGSDTAASEPMDQGSDMSADAGTDQFDADRLGSDTAASDPLDQDSDLAADAGTDQFEADPLDSDVAAGESFDQGSDMAADTLEPNTAASGTVDADVTTGSTIGDDSALHAASFQQICNTVESF